MTRNTKLYQITYNDIVIKYRDLTVTEVDYLSNIKNEVLRYESIAQVAIIEPTDTTSIPIGILLQIGNNAFRNSVKNTKDKDLFEITVKDFRKRIEDEANSPLPLVIEILKVIPGQSITDLLKLTYDDLIELVCMCEKIKGSQILSVAQGGTKKRGTKLIDPRSLPDDGKSLQQKMDELSAVLGNR